MEPPDELTELGVQAPAVGQLQPFANDGFGVGQRCRNIGASQQYLVIRWPSSDAVSASKEVPVQATVRHRLRLAFKKRWARSAV